MALNTNMDIESEVLVRLNASSTLAFYTDAILAAWFNDAYKWVAAYKKWPMTERRDNTTNTLTTATEEYSYPTDFRTGTIRLIQIGGKRFYKTAFYDYQNYKEDKASGTDKIWTDYGRTFFINPQVTDVTGTITVWGQFVPAAIDWTAAATTTVFSGGDEEANEAIVKEMMSYALQKERGPVSFYKGHYVSAATAHHMGAMELLDQLWKRVQDEQYGYLTKDRELWKRMNVERGALRDDLFKRDQFYALVPFLLFLPKILYSIHHIF